MAEKNVAVGAKEYIDGENFPALSEVLRGGFEIRLHEQAPQKFCQRIFVSVDFLKTKRRCNGNF